MNTERAIIVAAGQGIRLRPHTADRPKCMVTVGGRPMLDHALEALTRAGVSDTVLIRGYLGDQLNDPRYRTVENPDFATTNVLASLFCAEEDMEDGFIFSYADIVFGAPVAQALQDAEGDIVLVVDRDWQTIYDGREIRPETGAELTAQDGDRVLKIGVGTVPLNEAAGEFIGLAKFSPRGAALLQAAFHATAARFAETPDAIYAATRTFRKAYLTDLLQEMIDSGIDMRAVMIEGGWCEVDTNQDLARAERLFGTVAV